MPDARSHSPTAPNKPTQHKRVRRLDVYVSSECPNCAESVRLAAEVEQRFAAVTVRVIDLDRALDQGPLPDHVVAVPTYLLDGQIVSLGNPCPEELFARLSEAVG